MNIAICSPYYLGFTGPYVESLAMTLSFTEHTLDYLAVEGCFVDANRCLLAMRAKSAYNEAIVWIDSDVSWRPDDFNRLVSSGQANVGAIICGHVKAEDGQVFDRSLAFCWTPMSCFEKSEPWFVHDIKTGEGEDMYFFRTQERWAGRQVLSILLPGVRHKRLSL